MKIRKKLWSAVLLVVLLLQLLIFAACSPDGNYLDNAAKELSTYNIEAFFCPYERTITAEQKLVYRNNTETTLTELQLHLYPNAFREGAAIAPVDKSDESVAYPNGKSYGRIDVESVSVSGKSCEVKIGGQDEDILIVTFGKELFPKEKIDVEISFISYFPNMNHRFSYNDRVFNAGNWYPIACVWEDGAFVADPYYSYGDPFYSDMANYEVSLTCPESFMVASTGKTLARTVEEERQTLTISAKCVRDFAFVSSDQFETASAKAGEVDVNYFWLNDANAEKNLNISVAAVETFSELFGQYPYAALNVVQTDFCFGGMEYPNLIYIATGLNEGDMEKVIVHEAAHQWWYNLVGNNQVKHAWLDEGLTEFSTAYFFKKHAEEEYVSKYDAIISRAEKSFTVYTDIVKNYRGKVDTTMNRPSNEFDTQQQYIIMTYTKGMLMFDSLLGTVGEKRFEKALQNYFEENKTKIARPENLISCFEKAFGAGLENYFTAWLGNEGVVMN